MDLKLMKWPRCRVESGGLPPERGQLIGFAASSGVVALVMICLGCAAEADPEVASVDLSCAVSADCSDRPLVLKPCEEASCEQGRCVPRALSEGSVCRPASCAESPVVFEAAGICLKGVCLKGARSACDDGEVCTADGCDPTKGCTHAPASGACDDGSVCTTGDHCEGGVCTYDGKVCECALDADCLALEDGDLCNGTLICDQIAGKCAVDTATVVVCASLGDTGCLKNTCQPATGSCQQQALADGVSCDDGADCTEGDVCDHGVCIGVNKCN